MLTFQWIPEIPYLWIIMNSKWQKLEPNEIHNSLMRILLATPAFWFGNRYSQLQEKNLLAGVSIYTAKLKWPRVHVSKFIEQLWEFQSTIIIHPPSFKELAQAPFSVFHLAVISRDCWLLGIVYVLYTWELIFVRALDLTFSDSQFINFQWLPIFHLFAHAYNWRVFIVNCPKAEETP